MRRLYILFLLSSIFIIVSCNDTENSPTDINSEYLSEFQITTTKAGHKEWHLVAEKALQKGQDTLIVLFNFKLTFFENDSFKSSLVADSGLFFSNRGNLYAFKNVYVLTKDSVKLLTDSLFWNNEDKKLHAPGKIKLIRNNFILLGDDLQSNNNLDEIVIKHVEGKKEL